MITNADVEGETKDTYIHIYVHIGISKCIYIHMYMYMYMYVCKGFGFGPGVLGRPRGARRRGPPSPCPANIYGYM